LNQAWQINVNLEEHSRTTAKLAQGGLTCLQARCSMNDRKLEHSDWSFLKRLHNVETPFSVPRCFSILISSVGMTLLN